MGYPEQYNSNGESSVPAVEDRKRKNREEDFPTTSPTKRLTLETSDSQKTPFDKYLDPKYNSQENSFSPYKLPGLLETIRWGESQIIFEIFCRDPEMLNCEFNGLTPLKMSVLVNNQTATFHLLSYYGKAINEQDKTHGLTALHLAVMKDNAEIVELLLTAKPKLLPNREGKTPLDMAKEGSVIHPLLLAYSKELQDKKLMRNQPIEDTWTPTAVNTQLFITRSESTPNNPPAEVAKASSLPKIPTPIPTFNSSLFASSSASKTKSKPKVRKHIQRIIEKIRKTASVTIADIEVANLKMMNLLTPYEGGKGLTLLQEIVLSKHDYSPIINYLVRRKDLRDAFNQKNNSGNTLFHTSCTKTYRPHENNFEALLTHPKAKELIESRGKYDAGYTALELAERGGSVKKTFLKLMQDRCHSATPHKSSSHRKISNGLVQHSTHEVIGNHSNSPTTFHSLPGQSEETQPAGGKALIDITENSGAVFFDKSPISASSQSTIKEDSLGIFDFTEEELFEQRFSLMQYQEAHRRNKP